MCEMSQFLVIAILCGYSSQGDADIGLRLRLGRLTRLPCFWLLSYWYESPSTVCTSKYYSVNFVSKSQTVAALYRMW